MEALRKRAGKFTFVASFLGHCDREGREQVRVQIFPRGGTVPYWDNTIGLPLFAVSGTDTSDKGRLLAAIKAAVSFAMYADDRSEADRERFGDEFYVECGDAGLVDRF